jgi:hypothetical protein
MKVYHEKIPISPTKSTSFISVNKQKENLNNKYYTCTLALINALPIKVAPKKVSNGILKCPHVIPAKSNNGFGIEANNNIPKNPSF